MDVDWNSVGGGSSVIGPAVGKSGVGTSSVKVGSTIPLPKPGRFIGMPGELVNPGRISSETLGRGSALPELMGGERVVPGIDLHNRANWTPQIEPIASKVLVADGAKDVFQIRKGEFAWFCSAKGMSAKVDGVGRGPVASQYYARTDRKTVVPNILAVFGSSPEKRFGYRENMLRIVEACTIGAPTAVETFWNPAKPVQKVSYAISNHSEVIITPISILDLEAFNVGPADGGDPDAWRATHVLTEQKVVLPGTPVFAACYARGNPEGGGSVSFLTVFFVGIEAPADRPADFPLAPDAWRDRSVVVRSGVVNVGTVAKTWTTGAPFVSVCLGTTPLEHKKRAV